jgi:hypothetical protein
MREKYFCLVIQWKILWLLLTVEQARLVQPLDVHPSRFSSIRHMITFICVLFSSSVLFSSNDFFRSINFYYSLFTSDILMLIRSIKCLGYNRKASLNLIKS